VKGSAVNKQEKNQFVQEMNSSLKGIEWAFLFDYRGLKVGQANNLRRKIKEANSHYKVVKNTLIKLAVKDTLLENLSDSFKGPIGIAWTTEDPVSLAKVLSNFAKENKTFEFKSGVVSGKLINAVDFASLSKLPSRQDLLARLAYTLNAPARGLVTSLNEIMAQFVRVLGGIQKQKES
jgi:large subunit ribosomal protein L10